MKRQTVLFLLMAATFHVAAFDLDECNDQMDRVQRAARDVNTSISSSEDLAEIGSMLDEVQNRIDKARSACQANTPKSYCSQMRQMVMMGRRTEAKQLCAAHFEKMYPGFCGICLGR